MEAAVSKGCNELFVAIPNNLKRDYKKLKDFCLFHLNVVSQIACESTLGKKNVQSIATKILLQIIAKKGNILWVPSVSPQIKNTMIAAFDNAAIGGNPVVSCCATFNETFSRVFSNSHPYSSNEDKMKQMSILLYKSLEYYLKRNNNLPTDIIIFSNSCSNDQVKLYLEYFL